LFIEFKDFLYSSPMTALMYLGGWQAEKHKTHLTDLFVLPKKSIFIRGIRQN
jgi:hypothetical protein